MASEKLRMLPHAGACIDVEADFLGDGERFFVKGRAID
jgi:hypothetical protein